MKLHLPKRLFAALMAVFAMNVSTTVGSDVISINFGADKRPVSEDATGTLNGVTAANWNNISGNVTSQNLTGKSGTEYAGVLTLTQAQGNWNSGVADNNTLVSDMQYGYLDLGANNTWTIKLNMSSYEGLEHSLVDVVMYFAGDGTQFSPIAVGGVSYIGGSDNLAGTDTAWGDRSTNASATLGDHNTIKVTNVDVSSDLTINNVPQNNTSKRGSISGMQIIITDVYDAALAAGENVAESLTWAGPNGFSGAYSAVDAADRYLRADITAGDASLSFAAGAEVHTLHVKGSHVLTVTSTGDVNIDKFYTEAGTTIQLADILADTDTLAIGGQGTLKLTQSQTLAGITGEGNLVIADGVEICVKGLEYTGTVTAGAGSRLYGKVAANEAVTLGNVAITIDKAAEIDVLTGEIAISGDSTADLTLTGAADVTVVKGAGAGDEVTLALSGLNVGNVAGVQKLSAGEGVSIVSAEQGSGRLQLMNNQDLTIGPDITLNFHQTADNTDGRAIRLGNGTLKIDGASITADSIVLADGGSGRTSNLVIDNGGLLNITGDDNDGGKHGSICLNHWAGSTSNISIINGEFRALAAAVNIAEGGATTNVSIGQDGVMNVIGLKMHSSANISVGGKLNIGEYSIVNNTGTISVNAGGTLGTYADSLTTGQNISFTDGSTIQLSRYDMAAGTYTGGKADVTLTGRATLGGNIALAGEGTLSLSSLATSADVTLTGESTLALTGVYTLDHNVTRATGKTMLTDFSVQGTGMLTLGAVEIAGKFDMSVGKSLTLSSVVLAEGASLVYGEGDVVGIGAISSAVNLNVLGVYGSMAEGIDTGITVTEDTLDATKALLNVYGYAAEDIACTIKDGRLWISSAAEVQTEWDINWGSSLAYAPANVKAVTVPAEGGTFSLIDTVADNGTVVKATLKGDSSGTIVFGGAMNSPCEREVWIRAESGSYKAIVGGTYANNWGGDSPASHFNGDSHILVDGATVGTVMGGSYKDGKGATFTGNSYISVYTDTVTASIIGAGTNSHNNTSNFVGDTHIFVYAPLTSKNINNIGAGDGSDRSPGDAIIGGGTGTHNTTGTNNLTGSTHVTIDLSGVEVSEYLEEEASTVNFAKGIIGGTFNWSGTLNANINGDTNVNIIGKEGIIFTADIVGGSKVNGGSINTTGTSTVAIGGGSTYNGMIVGSSCLTGALTSRAGDAVVTLGEGTYNGVVIGGSYIKTGNGNVTTGNVTVNLTEGAQMGATLVGGGYVDGTAETAVTMTTGNVKVTLTGGEAQEIIGGSYVQRNNGDSIVRQGDVVVELNGGKVAGNIYAAGYQRAATRIETASTTVVLGSAVELAAGTTISGGYKYGESASGSTVTGNSTLVLEGTKDNSGIVFADFNTVTVNGTDNATIGALNTASAVTKNGTGVLTLAGGTYSLTGGLTVAEGKLVTTGETSLGGGLSLSNGVALDTSAGALTLNGELTLGTGLSLTTGALSMGDNTLMTGITSSSLTGSVAANTIFSNINDLRDISKYTLRVENGNLVLTTFVAKDVTWDEANSIWANNAQFGSAAEDVFANDYVAIFGTLTSEREEVTINGPLTAQEIKVAAGAGKTYSFVAGTNGTVSTEFLEIGEGTAAFAANTLQLGALSQVTIAEGGVLDLTAYGSAKMRDNFNTLLGVVSGDGTLKLAGSETIGNDAEIRLAQCGSVTIGNNYEFTNSIAIHGGGEDTRGVLTVGRDFTVEGELRAESFATIKVTEGGTLTSSSISLGHESVGNDGFLEIEGGSVVTGIIANTTGNTAGNTANRFTMTGGKLQLTTEGAVITGIQNIAISGGELVADGANWGVTGGSVGGVKVTGANTITLSGVTLTSTIDNSTGNLALSGAIDITSAGYVTTSTPSEYSLAGNEGFVRVNTGYIVASTAANLTVDGETSWTVDGTSEGVSYADGVVTVAGTDWGTEYYLRTDKNLSAIAKTNGENEALTTIVMAGGGMNINQNIGDVAIRVEKEGQTVVDIGQNYTLASSKVTADDTHQLKLHGKGTYILTDGTATLGTGVILGDWQGTVKVTNVYQSDGKMNIFATLNPLGDADSTVEVTNVKGYLNTGAENALTANLRLVNGTDGTAAITITNGNSDANLGARKASLQGAVSGSGDISFVTWGMSASYSATYEFAGEISGWTGSFINNSTGTSVGIANVVIAGDTEIKANFQNAENRSAASKLYLTIAGESDVTMKGAVNVDKLTVSQNTSFTNTVATTDLVTTAAASFAHDLTLTTLNNTGSVTAAGKNITMLGAVTGSGSITAASLTLQAAQNTMGALTLTDGLTLASSVTKLTTGALDIANGITINTLVSDLIAADSLGADLMLNIDDSILLTQISQSAEKSITLMTVTDKGEYNVYLNGSESDGYDCEDGQYRYELVWNNGTLSIVSVANGTEWMGDGDNNVWGDDSSWEGGSAPADNASVVFSGTGSSEVVIMGEVTAKNVTIDIAEDAATDSYEMMGTSSSDTLAITSNLSVNSGTLELGVTTTVANRTEVIEGATLDVVAGALSSQYGLDNAGELVIAAPTEQSQAVVNVTGGDLVNNGAITNGGILGIGYGAGNEEDSPSLVNNGTLVNAGMLGVDGDLVNIGEMTQEGVQTQTKIMGDLDNTGSLTVEAGSMTIAGTVTNEDTITVSDGSLSTGSMENTGSLAVSGGVVEVTGTLANSDTITVTDGNLAAGSLNNNGGSLTVTGEETTVVIGTTEAQASITNNGGSILVDDDASVIIYGSINNTGGIITVGTDAESTADLTITGDLTGTGDTNSLVVNTGSSLNVGGKLTATNVTLDLDGNVSVMYDAEIGNLTNDGTFTAASATITGTLANNGSLSVGTLDGEVLKGGKLTIGTLSGDGAVNVGEGGTLSIETATNFTGTLNNKGKIVVNVNASAGVTLSTATTEGGDITASRLTIAGQEVDGQYESANGSIMGAVTTDTIVLDKLDIELGTSHLAVESLTASTTEAVNIQINDLDVDALIGIGEQAYDLVTMGGTAPQLNLVNAVDKTSADMQKLLLNGLNIELSTAEAATYALRAATNTTVQLVVRELAPEEAVWTVGSIETDGGLIVLDNGTLKGASYLDYVRTVKVAGATELNLTDVDTAADNVVSLNGLTGAAGADLTVKGAGDYVSINNLDLNTDVTTDSTSYKGTLKLAGVTADLALQDVKVSAEDGSVVLKGSMNGGSLTIDATKGIGAASSLVIDGTDLIISNYSVSSDMTGVSVTDHVLVDLGGITGSEGELTIEASAQDKALMDKYFTNVHFDKDAGAVVADRNTSYFSDKSGKQVSANGAVGLKMADAALVALNPQVKADSDLGAVLSMIEKATPEKADELGASLAGASTAVLGMAAMGDVERQLKAIRNRTTIMGVDQSVTNDDMPYFNAWINAEGDRSELSENGTESGYTLNSWGGTVGFDVDFCPTLTAGMALTAMYGDLDTTGADTATGSMDSYYVSVFARYAPSAWTHTFVATVGTSDISLDRTVAGTQVSGETTGMSFGMMYEVGHVVALDEDGTACLQPVFNVTWRHSTVDGYTENGSDMALEVGEQTMDTVTFGLGARLQAVVGESMYNRTSILEARVLAKLDAGDRCGSSDVALASLPDAKGSVDSAEMGAFGLELGAGLTIPVGQDGGSLFMDASVELRSDYTNVNGTVGYRINF